MSSELAGLCRRTIRPRILAVGSRCLREAESVFPLIEQAGGEFVVLDPNEQFVQELRGESELQEIQAVVGCPFTAQRSELGAFHFIYALNLINELSDVAAGRVLGRLAKLLRRGGSLLVSNFSTMLADSAYSMPTLHRTFFRTEEEVGHLTDCIPDHDMLGQVVWTDESGTVIYLEVQK